MKQIKLFLLNIFKQIFAAKVFWPLFIVMILVATLDLIGLGNGGNFGAGWVLTFLYFFFFVLYHIVNAGRDT